MDGLIFGKHQSAAGDFWNFLSPMIILEQNHVQNPKIRGWEPLNSPMKEEIDRLHTEKDVFS